MQEEIKPPIVYLFWEMLHHQPFFVEITDEYIKNAKNTFFQEETIRYPDGTFRILSPKVGELFCKISETYLISEKDFARKIDFSDFHCALKDEMGAYLNAIPQNGTDEDIIELISKARAKLEQKFEAITYFFPLRFFDTIEVEKFNIGSVEIISQEAFSTEYKQKIIDSVSDKKEVTENEVVEWDNSPFTQAINKEFKTLTKEEKLDFIRQCRNKTNIHNKEILDSLCENKWVIKVEVGQCHINTSPETAKVVADQALNILKVIYTERHADKIKVIEFSESNKSYYLTEYKDQTFHISHSSRVKDQLGSGWYVYSQLYNYLLSEFAVILDSYLQFKPIDEYQFRIWEAVQWFTSSFSDETVGMKINKYCNAIERLVLSGEGNNKITTLFKTRAALLCAINQADYDNLIVQFKKLYSARSDYSHGRISHNESTKEISLLDALSLSRQVIAHSILFYQKHLKSQSSITQDSIRNAFDNATFPIW